MFVSGEFAHGGFLCMENVIIRSYACTLHSAYMHVYVYMYVLIHAFHVRMKFILLCL